MTLPHFHEDREQRPLTRGEGMAICIVLFVPGLLLAFFIIAIRNYEPPMPASCAGYLPDECTAIMGARP